MDIKIFLLVVVLQYHLTFIASSGLLKDYIDCRLDLDTMRTRCRYTKTNSSTISNDFGDHSLRLDALGDSILCSGDNIKQGGALISPDRLSAALYQIGEVATFSVCT